MLSSNSGSFQYTICIFSPLRNVLSMFTGQPITLGFSLSRISRIKLQEAVALALGEIAVNFTSALPTGRVASKRAPQDGSDVTKLEIL